MEEKKVIDIDFDGTLNSYLSGWLKPDEVLDEPVKGAIEWLTGLVLDDRFTTEIFSCRANHIGGPQAMAQWLVENGLSRILLKEIEFRLYKPVWHVLLDDRVMQFNGEFPTLDELYNFKPWYKR